MFVKHFNTGTIPPSQLILRDDSTVYHLGIKGDQIADTVLLVGDPERVEKITAKLDNVVFSTRSREFVIQTGTIRNKHVTVVSTGIGVDNIDIVINEIDAAVNIDPQTRKPNTQPRSLQFIRLGTCGALRAEIEVGTLVASAFAIGMDGVPWHYDVEMTEREQLVASHFKSTMNWPANLAMPYAAEASKELLDLIAYDFVQGITLTANGFYGPQGRSLRLPLKNANYLSNAGSVEAWGYSMVNFEMECAGIYALASALRHRALTCCAVLANRVNEQFTDDPEKHVNRLIDAVLARL